MAINSIRISGKVVCDYIWYLNRKLTTQEKEFVSDRKNEPSWNLDTGILVTFNESLLAGNVTNGSNVPTTWRIYRRDVKDGSMTLASVTDSSSTSVTDYNVVNGKTYEYILFAETEGFITLPIESESVNTEWTNFCLFDVDSTDIPNKYKMHECFLFEYNVDGGSMSNNLIATKLDNFTQYPKFVRAQANYYSSTLTGLLGHIGSDGEYYDSADMLDALSAFTASPRRKFLKDRRGHVWQVEISAPMTETQWSNFGGKDPYNVSIPWTQTGSTDGIMLN